MSEVIPFGDIIIIAAVAAFIILRYRSILGQKTGHDVEKAAKARKAAPATASKPAPMEDTTTEQVVVAIHDKAYDKIENGLLRQQIDAIKAVDAAFRLEEFLSGARSAFEMVIDAYNKKEYATLKMLLAEGIYEEFKSDLMLHDAKKEEAKTTLVSIQSTEIQEAILQKTVATLRIKFVTEQIQYIKNEAGDVISGDVSLIEEVEDIWSFERDMKSRNPNWKITDI